MKFINDTENISSIIFNITGPLFYVLLLAIYAKYYKMTEELNNLFIKSEKTAVYIIYNIWMIFLLVDLIILSLHNITASEIIKFISYSTSIVIVLHMTRTNRFFHNQGQLISLTCIPFLLDSTMMMFGLPGWPSRFAECLIQLVIIILMIIKKSRFNADQIPLIEEKNKEMRSYFWHVKMIWQYMWPKKKYLLKLNILLSFLILLSGRGVNLLIPIYVKKIIDGLSEVKSETFEGFPWKNILLYGVFMIISSRSGVLACLKSFLWIPVEQNMTKDLAIKLYRHLLNLSFKWHLNKKTGEILRIVERGKESLKGVIEYLIFRILPTIADTVIAVVYLSVTFNWIFGIIILVTMILYFVCTIAISQIRMKYRREMNNQANDLNAKAVDVFMNFETVKSFANENYETELYEQVVLRYQKWEWKVLISLEILNISQSGVFIIGMIASLLVMGHKISKQSAGYSVGDFALLMTYLQQIQAPLGFLGTVYRMVIQAFVDMEKVFDLMKLEPEEAEKSNYDLSVSDGIVEFKNVSYAHENQKFGSLSNITLSLAPNKVVALVGETGSGKSTLIRLLLRLFKHDSGKILIDGHDITNVSLNSLRKAINIVSQDSSLFNETISFNVKYGMPNCHHSEVVGACGLAEINDFIESLVTGYESLVGERGLKLSGGEKQRLTIARSLIKKGNIIVFDEASSSLDNVTEKKIFANLNRFFKNCSQLIIAHRLTTIEHADEIIVLDKGIIVERGTHAELLESKGNYYTLWTNQAELQ